MLALPTMAMIEATTTRWTLCAMLAATALLFGLSAHAQGVDCTDACDDGDACLELAATLEPTEAACVLQVGCNLGNSEACRQVALAWARGLGVEQDMGAARLFFEESCYLGDVIGCGGLGVMYAEGLGGPALPSDSVDLLRPACEADYGPACRTLGWLYEQGRGVPADRVAAESLYDTGCNLDDGRACDMLAALRAQTTAPTPVPVADAVPDALAAALRAAADGTMDAAAWITLPTTPMAVDDEGAELRLSRPVLMQSTEVTLAQWVDVVDTVPLSALACSDPTCPVVGISWWDALAFSNALSARAGLDACYVMVDCEGVVGVDLTCASATFVGVGCGGYRLPTFGEVTLAARGGLEGSLPCDADDACVDRAEWHAINAEGDLQSVAQLLPSTGGFYDLLGNAREWVWDDGTSVAAGLDPVTPFGDGAWSAGASVRAQRADLYRPLHSSGPIAMDSRVADLGMRLVRTDTAANCGTGLVLNDNAGLCCWPGQDVRAGRCAGQPSCPPETLAVGDSCSGAAWLRSLEASESARRDRLRGGIFEREFAVGIGVGFAAFGWKPSRIQSDPLPRGAPAAFADELPYVSVDSYRRPAFEVLMLTRTFELGVGTRLRYGDFSGLRTSQPTTDSGATIRTLDNTWTVLSMVTLRAGLRGLTWPRYRRNGYVIFDPSFGVLGDVAGDLEIDGAVPARRAYFIDFYLGNTMTFGPVFISTRVDIPLAAPGWPYATPVAAEFTFGGWLTRRIRGGE